jgi:predicted RNase H-like HicB family nuclease
MKTKVKNKKIVDLPVLIEQDENGMFVGSVPSLRSCYTQGKTLKELYKNLEEVVDLCIEAEKEFFGRKIQINKIIGFQNMSFSFS